MMSCDQFYCNCEFLFLHCVRPHYHARFVLVSLCMLGVALVQFFDIQYFHTFFGGVLLFTSFFHALTIRLISLVRVLYLLLFAVPFGLFANQNECLPISMSALRCAMLAMDPGDQPSFYGDLNPRLWVLSGYTSCTSS